MAYFKTGTALGHVDLLDKIVSFLSTELPVAERWQVLRYTGVTDIHASSFLVNYEPFTAFKGPYGVHPNGWATAVGEPSNSWLAWTEIAPKDLARLTLRGGPTLAQSPKDFRLQWYDDANAVWRDRQVWTGETWTANQTKTWTLAAWPTYTVGGVPTDLSGPKSKWRLFVNVNNGDTNYTRVEQVSLPEFSVTADFNHARRPAAWLKAPGLTGLDPVYINFQIYDRPTNDFFNLAMTGTTGFVGAADFDNQPGARAALALPLWEQPITYWLQGNGQRLTISCKVDTVYMSCYLGKIMTYGTPGQFPYPLLLAAPLSTASATRYSDAAVALPYKGNRGQMVLRKTDGVWVAPFAWPYSNPVTFRTVNGAYPSLPIVLYDALNTYGFLDGLSHISGFGNAVENTLTLGAEEHIVLQDGPRNGISDFYTQRTL